MSAWAWIFLGLVVLGVVRELATQQAPPPDRHWPPRAGW